MARIKNKSGDSSFKIGNVYTTPSSILSLAIVLFVILWVTINAITSSSSSDDESSQKANGFTINSYDVTLDVREDNKVNVTEKITVNWENSYHHGILKFIPEWLQYTGKDGKTIKRKAIVSNLSAIGEPFSVDTVKNGKKKRIKIGDPYNYADVGLHEYTITYTYDMGSDPFNNGDEFIFHAFGDYWGTIINNATIEINMPKNIDGNNINFFFDKYRKQSANDYVDYKVIGNQVNISFNSEKYKNEILEKERETYCYEGSYHVDESGYCTLPSYATNDAGLTKSLTVDLELPEGYFIGGSNNYGINSLLICIVIILMTLFSFYRWIRHGKDLQKASQTVEFYPPEDYDPAEIGYIYGKQTGKKLTISLIVGLASKGYIKIEESEDKKTRTIINLLPVTKSVTNEKIRTIRVSKQKEVDNTLTTLDATWMKYLFRNGNTKDIIADFDNFYKKSDNLIKQGYIKIESDTTTDSESSLIENEMVKNLKPLTETEKIVYNQLFNNGTSSENILNEDNNFYTAFWNVSNSLETRLKDKIDDRVSKKKMTLTFVILAVCVVLWFVSYFYFQDLNPLYNKLYFISFISLPIMAFFGIIMGRKTEYGELITARVLGFKNYLETAEKNQLEAQVEKNPHYFYDILPYAYVLGVSKKWIEKFENIPIPQTDMGNFNYYDINSFNSIADSVHFPVPSSSSSGGGCSSCGGGCSSCGGGCSSCGGGGSW